MNYIIEKAQYESVVAKWKQTKSHTAAEHIIYNALRGFDPKRGFTPITHSNKLANGAQLWDGYNTALYTAKWLLREANIRMGKYATELDILLRTDSENERIKQTSDKFGVEITSELRTKLLELLK